MEYFRHEGDWFVKADDDTYMVMENLRFMLSQYKTEEPWYFGCKFKRYVTSGYMSGGAGYVLSKEALKKLVTIGLEDKKGTYCRQDEHGPEDLEIGKCMEKLNVSTVKSRAVDCLG